MTEVNMRQTLNILREQQYGVWFERWYNQENVPRSLREAAEKGATRLVLYDRDEFLKTNRKNTDGRAEYLVSRFEDELMVPMLAKRLPSLSVFRKKWVENVSFFGLGGQTINHNQIIIDWSEG